MKVDVCIPTYEAGGYGHIALNFSFAQIARQSFHDFQVIISDHSKDDKIERLCKTWGQTFDIKYIRNERGRGVIAANLNCLLDNADGDIIKWLDQDDYLFDPDSLKYFAGAFQNPPTVMTRWVATSYFHTKDRTNYYNQHFPNLHQMLFIENTVGTMSCTAFRNFKGEMPRFDENLRYHHDCDWYWQYWKKFGNPTFYGLVSVANFIWENSFTSTQVDQKLIDEERQYLVEKYGKN